MNKQLQRKRLYRAIAYAITIAIFNISLYVFVIWNIKDYLKENILLYFTVLILSLIGFPMAMIGQAELVSRYERRRLMKTFNQSSKQKD